MAFLPLSKPAALGTLRALPTPLYQFKEKFQPKAAIAEGYLGIWQH